MSLTFLKIDGKWKRQKLGQLVDLAAGIYYDFVDNLVHGCVKIDIELEDKEQLWNSYESVSTPLSSTDFPVSRWTGKRLPIKLE